jgi:putative ABC transport system permease protein
VFSILKLVSREFLVMIMLSLVIAFPVVYYLMKLWLQNFAYAADIDWPIFILASMLSISLAILTISAHAIKVANGNPINSLRAE